MLGLYRKLKISHKMTVVFSLICIVSVLVSTFTIYRIASKNIDRETRAFAAAISSQTVSNMQNFMQSYEGIMLSVLVDSDIFSEIVNDYGNTIELAEDQTEMKKLLSRLITMEPNIIFAGVFLSDGQSFQTGESGEKTDPVKLREQGWFQEGIEGKDSFFIVPLHLAEYTNRPNRTVISVAQKLYARYRKYVGVILLDIDISSILNLGDAFSGEDGIRDVRVVVENDQHAVLYDSGLGEELSFSENGFLTYTEPGEGFEIISEELTELGMTVHTIWPESVVLLRKKDILWIAAATIIFCFAFALISAAAFSETFTRPIRKLRSAISEMENERYVPVEGETGQDEFGLLIDNYNHMVHRMEYLIEEVYRTDLQRKSAQLTALQTQINPHMLFNTLESIRMKALISGNREVAEMTRLLGKMFRMVLENVNRHHTIRDELDYVSSFMKLQNMRYSSENILTIEVPEEIKELLCPVILFQPLAENSLRHGMPEGRAMEIRIDGKMTDDGKFALFTLTDNGIGIEPDRLMMISDRLDEIRKGGSDLSFLAEDGRIHIGLENIARRLQLQYGKESYLKIAYSNESGTSIEICLKAEKLSETSVESENQEVSRAEDYKQLR